MCKHRQYLNSGVSFNNEKIVWWICYQGTTTHLPSPTALYIPFLWPGGKKLEAEPHVNWLWLPDRAGCRSVWSLWRSISGWVGSKCREAPIRHSNWAWPRNTQAPICFEYRLDWRGSPRTPHLKTPDSWWDCPKYPNMYHHQSLWTVTI